MANTVDFTGALHFEVTRVAVVPHLRISNDADGVVLAENAIYAVEPGSDGVVASFSVFPVSANLIK